MMIAAYCRHYVAFPLYFLALLVVALSVPVQSQEQAPKLLNPDFAGPAGDDGIPSGWYRYGLPDDTRRIAVLRPSEAPSPRLLIEDMDDKQEIGVTQAVPAQAGLWYQATAHVIEPEANSASGAYMQMRFLPSNRLSQVDLTTGKHGAITPRTVTAFSPPGTTRLTLYIYTHKAPTPRVLVDRVELTVVAGPPPKPAKQKAAPTMTAPKPVPPTFDRLKDLHLETPLVAEGKPVAAIIVRQSKVELTAAQTIRDAIANRTGVALPIISDEAPEARLPLKQAAILLGNRSTNRTISELYERFYTLLDLKYPGPAGHVVRTVHNPLGDGVNCVLVGASDAEGLAKATTAFSNRISSVSASQGSLTLGHVAEIQLSHAYEIPKKPGDIKIWEASGTYRSSGYFGWAMISKHMAAYYMTGDEYHAREFLRLAFPDEATIKDLEAGDGERIENKHDPLAGPYHYSAHMMILFWDLIEEDPFFTDEQRLRITNAFSRQLSHRAHEGVYGRFKHRGYVGNRHADWSAMALYCVARYFQKDYPNPVWDASLRSVKSYFSALNHSAWLAGNNDHLFWYTSYYDPIVDYMIMSGDHVGVESGHFAEALQTQDVLFNGSDPDWGVKASSLNFLHRAAYLTGDGRWLFYRDRTGLDTDVFRLGQSYWPHGLTPRPPEELIGKWTIQKMPTPMWKSRGSAIPEEQSFLWGSFRSSLDASGDFLLIKGHNGGGRNPYHTFVPLELRLAGYTVLKGYHSQVLTSADGMVEPKVAMNSGLLKADVIGDTAYAVGHVPGAAFCDWRRTLVQRTGRYALVVDTLSFRTDTENMSIETSWNTIGGRWRPSRRAVEVPVKPGALPAGWTRLKSLDATCSSSPSNEDGPRNLIQLGSIGITLVKATKAGHWIEMPFELSEAFNGELSVDLLNYKDRGRVDILLDGERVVEDVQHHSVGVESLWVPLQRRALTAGTHQIRIVARGCPEGADRCYIGLAGIVLRPDGALPASAGNTKSVDICSSDPMEVKGTGVVKMTWTGPARSGARRHLFHLIAPRSPGHDVHCRRLDENVAFLALPQPALAVSGKRHNTDAEIAILEQDGFFTISATALAVPTPDGAIILKADSPVDAEWDFGTAHLHITASTSTKIILATTPSALPALNGAPVAEPNPEQPLELTLPAGHHVFTNARLDDALRQTWQTALAKLASQSAPAVEKAPENAPPASVGDTPVSEPVRVGKEPVKQVVSLEWNGKPAVAAASGKQIAISAAPGDPLTTLTTGATIRTLHWWEAQKLLLAACLDEKVIAFGPDGKRHWEFVSEMHQAVYDAAKQYWFKSAHPGIWGLDSGPFVGGQQQCFVGSACTLEILDAAGKLVKRIPVFWGPGWRFGLLPKADGSTNLLIGRQPTDTHALSIINSNDLRVTGRAFDGVPPGHTYVTGWSTMSRNHLFVEDIDADGELEVVSEVNGFWNRITVWNADGSPRHNAQLGPGDRIPKRNVRGVALADLNGDGKQEILVALKQGLLTALTHTCERLWSQRLPGKPVGMVTRAATANASPTVVVCCENGIIAYYDSTGKLQEAVDINTRTTAIADTPIGTAVGTQDGRLFLLP